MPELILDDVAVLVVRSFVSLLPLLVALLDQFRLLHGWFVAARLVAPRDDLANYARAVARSIWTLSGCKSGCQPGICSDFRGPVAGVSLS